MPNLALKGYRKVDSQLLSFSHFKERAVREVNRGLASMESQARKDVIEVVYSAPENPEFERSGNMAASTDVILTSDADSVAANVMLNPDKATLPFNYTYGGDVAPSGLRSYFDLIGRAGKKWYASYVRRGIFFRKTGAPRDYKAKWRETLIPKYIANMGKALRNFKI